LSLTGRLQSILTYIIIVEEILAIFPWFFEFKELVAQQPNLVLVSLGNNNAKIDAEALCSGWEPDKDAISSSSPSQLVRDNTGDPDSVNATTNGDDAGGCTDDIWGVEDTTDGQTGGISKGLSLDVKDLINNNLKANSCSAVKKTPSADKRTAIEPAAAITTTLATTITTAPTATTASVTPKLSTVTSIKTASTKASSKVGAADQLGSAIAGVSTGESKSKVKEQLKKTKLEDKFMSAHAQEECT
jgi:hypothetical protein